MTHRPVAAAIVCAALGIACEQNANAQKGGALEEQLLAATVARDVTRVAQALAAGADPNKMVRDADGHLESPWRFAIRHVRGDKPDTNTIVKALLEAHADPAVAWGESHGPRGWGVPRTTPLLEAVSNAAPQAVRALIASGLDRANAPTALVLAIETGQSDVVRMLVEAGVDVNTTHAATTPLVAAINARNVALMTYLEEHGAREKP